MTFPTQSCRARVYNETRNLYGEEHVDVPLVGDALDVDHHLVNASFYLHIRAAKKTHLLLHQVLAHAEVAEDDERRTALHLPVLPIRHHNAAV